MHGQKESVFVRSSGTITGITSLILTFSALPFVWMRTTTSIERLAGFYSSSEGFTSLVSLIWLALLAGLIYSLIRLALSALFSAIALFVVLYFSKGND